MFRSTSQILTRAALCSATLVLAGAAYGSAMPPNSTLDPVPGASLPLGTVLEQTISKPFTFNKTEYIQGPGGVVLPILRTVEGTLTQRVYREPDNSVTFAFTCSTASTSGAEVTEFSARDYSEYTTDVSQFGGLAANQNSVSSATRSSDGGTLTFNFDSGITTGWSSRAAYIDTNATSYLVPGRFQTISSRATVGSGSAYLNIYGFAYPVEDSSPPIVSLATPAALTSVCTPAQITGRAYDPNGFDSYALEYSANPNGPWTQILESSTAVSSTGPLGSWNTNSPVNVAQGYYFLRLTAFNAAGMTSSVTNIVWVDKQFDTVDVRSPQDGNILGGYVCFDGTVSDNNGTQPIQQYAIQYAPLPAASPFQHVNPATPAYTQGVVNDGLGSWLTSSGPAAVADGSYRVRVTGTDLCGNTRTVSRDIIIDNTAPIATITSPTSCDAVGGQVSITGSVSDTHLAGWVVQYSGGNSHGWVTIASGNNSINNGTLGVWNTTGLPPCAYTLRVVASDSAGISCSGNTNQTEYHTSVIVGCPGDFNRSGTVSVQDVFDFLTAYFAGCP
ncbi:MAG: hypothetical protein IT438_03425 [Phycisphaerales bacterium]|nr:hypothetical protein [Phycisphaerales bacterium]